MRFEIADLIIDINDKFAIMPQEGEKFLDKSSKLTDAYIDVEQQEIDKWQCVNPDLNYNLCMSTLILNKISNILFNFNAFLLHSTCFDVGGVGIAFAAHSGTGKTTHMQLWQKYLGDKMIVVNGDKPMVRFFDSEPNTPYAYGTPWNGKERYGCNMRTPLKHVCFIERSEKNFVEPIEKADAINRIFNQVYMPKDPIAMSNTVDLIDRLLSCCKLWIIHCNMDISAAETAYKTIFGIKE